MAASATVPPITARRGGRSSAYSPSPIGSSTIYDDPETQARAGAAGVAAFVSKRESPEGLPATIRRALHG